MAAPTSVEDTRHVHVTVVGLGYVGLVTAACLASAGHRVRGTDASLDRIASLRAGRLPLFEPGLDALVAQGVGAGRLSFDTDVRKAVAESDLVVVAVGTHDGNGGWQVRSITDCLRLVAEHAREGAVVAIRSTLPPDALDRLGGRARALRARALPGSDLPIVLNPEFTREGTAVDDFLHPDRIVIGALDDPTGAGTSRVAELYAGFDAPILRMNAHDACLTKLASNLFLATKISFANELARLCDRFGARVDHVVEGMSLDPRIGGAFLRPGVGFGGSCLPHQVAMTVRSFTEDGEELPLLAAVQHVNEQQQTRFVALLDQLVEGLPGRRIALLGLTFKPEHRRPARGAVARHRRGAARTRRDGRRGGSDGGRA